MQSLEPILAQHPFFKGFEPHYMQLITGCASNVRFPAGYDIFREGEPASSFYIIRQGQVALTVMAAQQGLISSRRLRMVMYWAGRGSSRPIAGTGLRPRNHDAFHSSRAGEAWCDSRSGLHFDGAQYEVRRRSVRALPVRATLRLQRRTGLPV